jgi:hypothetical protein
MSLLGSLTATTGIGIAIVLVVVGLLAYRTGLAGRSPHTERTRLEECDFSPFTVGDDRQVIFGPERFSEAVSYFPHHRTPAAAHELAVIGEQNLARSRFGTQDLDAYRRLCTAYDVDSVISDNEAPLENCKQILHRIRRSFPHTGIEILLLNLVSPSRSIVAIENDEVTGRRLEMGTTNHSDVKNKKGITSIDLGAIDLKHLDEPVHLYEILQGASLDRGATLQHGTLMTRPDRRSNDG